MINIDNILIIKVGTSTLTKRSKDGKLELDIESFKRIGQQVNQLQREGFNVAIISSAAIGAGMIATKLTTRPAETVRLQSLASIGWHHILNAWREVISATIGGLLITARELETDPERSELLHVLSDLFAQCYVPIINENDAITHNEITFGDNDILAVQLAEKIKRSPLFGNTVSVILLSNIDGVYEKANDAMTRIATISNTDAWVKSISEDKSDGGSGGMRSKFTAANIATTAGIDMYIANGNAENSIHHALTGISGTRFIKKKPR